MERVAFKAELDGVVVYEQVVEEGTEAPCSTAPGCESYIWTLHRDPVVTIQADFTEEGALAMAVMPGAYTGSVSVWEAGESLELVTGAALASLTLRNVPGPWVPAFLAHLDSGHIVLALESLLDFTAARIFWGQPELLVERRLSEPASYSMIGGVHVVQFDLDGLPATVWFSSYAGAGEYIVVGDCALSFTRDPDRDYAVGRRYCCLND